MVDSISGSSGSDVYSLAQQIQDFKDGTINLTKQDVQSNIIKLIEQGETPSDTLLDLYESYDEIDQDGNGISYDEFETYKNSTQGILSTLGLSTNADYTNLMTSALLGSSSTSGSLLSSLYSDDSTEDSVNSYYTSILESYSGSNTTSTTSYSDISLADYLV